MKPSRSDFTPKELSVIDSHRTPYQVQRYLSSLPYNRELCGATLLSFRGVIKITALIVWRRPLPRRSYWSTGVILLCWLASSRRTCWTTSFFFIRKVTAMGLSRGPVTSGSTAASPSFAPFATS